MNLNLLKLLPYFLRSLPISFLLKGLGIFFIFGALYFWHLNKIDIIKKNINIEYQKKVDAHVKNTYETQSKIYKLALNSLKEKNVKLQNINTRLNDSIDELRKRESRTIIDAATISGNRKTCTGAELSREDATFLAREAARAQQILIERDRIYGLFYDLQKEFNLLKQKNVRRE